MRPPLPWQGDCLHFDRTSSRFCLRRYRESNIVKHRVKYRERVFANCIYVVVDDIQLVPGFFEVV